MAGLTPDGPKVVLLASKIRDGVRWPVVTKLENYWDKLRGTRLLPSRSEVDPREIENTLENAFILERIAPGIARFRLAGMHLNELMGMEVRGMPLTAFIAPDERRSISDVIEEVFQRPASVLFHLTAEDQFGRPALEARLLLLPLKSDLGDVSRVLAFFVTEGEIGRTPRRFSIRETQITPILTDEPLRRVGGTRRMPGAALDEIEVSSPTVTHSDLKTHRDALTAQAAQAQQQRPRVNLDENGRPILRVISNETVAAD